MVVKKTKKGHFSFALSYDEREAIFSALCNFLEEESFKLWRINMAKEAEVMRHLYYSTLDELIRRKNFALLTTDESKWIITRPEALALMWLLRHQDNNMAMLELKSGLHKQLHS